MRVSIAWARYCAGHYCGGALLLGAAFAGFLGAAIAEARYCGIFRGHYCGAIANPNPNPKILQ